jgi:hypothetical protein
MSALFSFGHKKQLSCTCTVQKVVQFSSMASFHCELGMAKTKNNSDSAE